MRRRKALAVVPERPSTPGRGQVWYVDLGEPLGHEQGHDRPFLVVSVDDFNEGGGGVVVGLPLTTTDRGIPLHVKVHAPEAGIAHTSFVQPEGVRAISKLRLRRAMGYVGLDTMSAVEDRVRVLLGL